MFKVLSAHGDDAVGWDGYIQMLPYDLRDVHFTSGWGRSQERDGATAHLAVWMDQWFLIVQPFLLWPIPGNRGQDTGLSDMTTAGDGGPACNANLLAPGDADEFEREFDLWRTEHGVLTEFYMLNPVTAVSQLPLIDRAIPLHHVRTVNILPLGMDMPMHKNRVQSLAKAERAKITNDFDIANFDRHYSAAMQAKAAADRWRLSVGDLAALDAHLGKRVQMLNASDARILRAQAIFFLGTGATAYYYLAARSDEPADGFADRLVIEAMHRAKFLGNAYLHLGGGLKDGDSLDAYKASFGGLRRPVYSVQRIFEPTIYETLARGHKSGFFPAYRAEEIAK